MEVRECEREEVEKEQEEVEPSILDALQLFRCGRCSASNLCKQLFDDAICFVRHVASSPVCIGQSQL